MREDWTECEYQDFLDYIQPTKYIVKNTDYNDKYDIPVLTAGKTFIKGYTKENNGVFKNLPVIIFDDFTTASKFVNFPFKVKSSAMKILVPSCQLVNMKYIFYSMQVNHIRSDTHKRYWISVYAKKRLFIPPLPEQRAIVARIEELFSELDNGIANLKRAQGQLKVYRQAVLKKAFEGELTKEWREKQTNLPSAEDLLGQIKEVREKHYSKQLEAWEKSLQDWEDAGKPGKKPAKPKKHKELPPLTEDELNNLPKLPKSWKYNFLSYAGDLGRGKSKHRPRNDKVLFNGNYPFIQTAEVKSQEVITKYTQTYNEVGLAQSKLWPKGTLCITIAANIAETGFLGIDACFPDSVVGFSPFHFIINIKYVDYFFQSAKRKITAWAPATAQKNINLTILENLIIPFCSLEEQQQIVQEIESRLSVCDKVEETIKDNLEKAEALRQSILKKAFEGKLLTENELKACRNESDWEPAEKLLERIKSEKGKK